MMFGLDKIDYTKLEAGRELDELVAEKVLRWQRHHDFYDKDGFEHWYWLDKDGKMAASRIWLNDNPVTPYFSRDLADCHKFLLPNIDYLFVCFTECLSTLLFPNVKVSMYKVEAKVGNFNPNNYIWGLVNATPHQCCIAALQGVDLKYELDNDLASDDKD